MSIIGLLRKKLSFTYLLKNQRKYLELNHIKPLHNTDYQNLKKIIEYSKRQKDFPYSLMLLLKVDILSRVI